MKLTFCVAIVFSYRGLTTIQARSAASGVSGSLRRSQPLRNGLSSSWSSSSLSSAGSSCESSASSGPSSPFESSPSPRPSHPHSVLVSSFTPEVILVRPASGGPAQFKLPAPQAFKTVNLRHFGLQAAKFATISDIVVYGPDGLTDEVVETAVAAYEAVEHQRRSRAENGIGYNVFVVCDTFEVFEREFPHRVAIDSSGFVRNKLNFLDREREEMRVLTQASEIGENVFLGNTQDVPLPSSMSGRPLSSDSASSILNDNPLGVAVCIEAHDQALNPSAQMLASTERTLHDLEAEARAFQEVTTLLHAGVTVADDASSRYRSTCGAEYNEFDDEVVLRVPVDSIAHLECQSTGAGASGNNLTQFINSLVNLAGWIIDQSTPATDKLPRRVLLHCNDGYTETSLLALTYVMLVRRCNAPEAYLYLQHQAERSFFVYPADVATLTKIEQRVGQVIRRADAEREREQIRLSTEKESSPMERSDSGYVEDGNEGSAAGPAWAIKAAKVERALPALPELKLSRPEDQPWFFGSTFEGHFPSRILPFLYLGNLAHANNALMLKELGITHVVSMGESALSPPRPPPFSLTAAFSRQATLPDNSLWLEERLGHIAVLDQKNVADDGIDSLRPHIDSALEFIERARQEGGRVLVHCRVGVSRSASIVIAYLMRHVELDLASAYLLTRSRRLNILIQPNLPFMATLHAFEADLLREKEAARARLLREGVEVRDEDEGGQLGRAGLKRSNRLGWSTLAHEIAVLNERFLC